MASSRFIWNFKDIRKPGTYKCSDKRCKICQNQLNETNKFTISNGQFGKFAEKLTAAQSMPYIIWNIKCVAKKKHILGKQGI